jgi:2-C-methyl-D-erythritol 4-phosphate cytidylyltransferase
MDGAEVHTATKARSAGSVEPTAARPGTGIGSTSVGGAGPATAAVVLAAGRGERYGQPKQFELIDGATLVDRAVATAQAVCDVVILVLPIDDETTPPSDRPFWGNGPVHSVVRGGRSRSESARVGLRQVPPSVETVVLASASHPLAGPGLFRRTIAAVAAGADAAAPMALPADAVKRRSGNRIVRSVPKTDLVTVQSPCAFSRSLLDRAYRELGAGGKPLPPEELEMIEQLGGTMVLVEGEPTNIHVTTPAELEMARRLCELVPDAVTVSGDGSGLFAERG